MSKENRPIKITFRVSALELIEIERLCKFAGLNMSDLVRMAVLTAKIKSPEIPLIDQATFVELKRIGNNFNQIARSVNSGSIEHGLLIENMQSIKEMLDRLIKYLIRHDS